MIKNIQIIILNDKPSTISLRPSKYYLHLQLFCLRISKCGGGKLYIFWMEDLFNRPFVGYDGSLACESVLQAFRNMHGKFEKSHFVYVWTPTKNYIPRQMRGPAIEQKLKEQIKGLDNVSIKLIQREHDSDKTVNQCLLEEFFISKSTFLILGYYGSKGPKHREADLSSRVQRFIYDSKTTIALIKHSLRNNNTALFCFDGSEISIDGLNKAVDFCRKFNLLLTVFHAYNQDTKEYSKRIKTWLKAFQQSEKSVKIEPVLAETDIISYLCEKQTQYDWIILNKNGYRGEISNKVYVGSTASTIITAVSTNMIILA